MVKPEKIVLDKKTFLIIEKDMGKLRWMISVNNVGWCGLNSLDNIVEAIGLRGKCSTEAMTNLINYFFPVEKSAGDQLELF